MERPIGFVGLGAMGMPMAVRLLEQGFRVTVVPHRSRARAQEMEARGAQIVDAPAAAVAAGSEVVLLSLPSAAAVSEVIIGPRGVLRDAPEGLVIVDTSTIGPDAAREMARQSRAVGAEYLDCPVSGGPARASSGSLTAILGGREQVIDATRDVVDVIASQVFVVGDIGAGQVVKICNNLVLAACMLANAEALALADAAGIPRELVREVVLASSGSNWQLENIVPMTILRDDYAPLYALPLLMKDLRIADEAARAQGVGTPLLGELLRMYGAAAARSDASVDFSSVYRLYERPGSVTSVPGTPTDRRDAGPPSQEPSHD
jgi:3-hydroxyisobutyrate dehydrogenase-like beta-hydroxyacid dehydrogenase